MTWINARRVRRCEARGCQEAVATIAGGARCRFNDNVRNGVGYETPITDRKDIMDWRVYVDLVLSF